MRDDINTLWALVSASLLLVANGASIAMIEGISRGRVVSTGAARHLAGFAGAVIGVASVGYGLALGDGGTIVGGNGFFLDGVDLSSVGRQDLVPAGLAILHLIALCTLVCSLALAATTERATHFAHCVVGLVVGGLFVPLVVRASRPAGLLGSIEIDGAVFDITHASTIFTMVGWFGLIGALVIGPRLGRIGSTGQLRAIPGRSPVLVVLGAALFVVGAPAFTVLEPSGWSDTAAEAAVMMLLGAAAGTVVAGAIGHRRYGDVGTLIAARGALAGTVAASGIPLDRSPMWALLVGATGAVAAIVAVIALGHRKVDDPLGVAGIFGVAAVVGTLLPHVRSLDAFVAHAVGVLVVIAWSVLLAGVVFGVLRMSRLLRLRPEVEIVGLDT